MYQTLLLIFAFFCTFCCSLQAQSLSSLPITLTRIHSLDDIEDGAVYAIAGMKNDSDKILLSCKQYNKKLLGRIVEDSENEITISDNIFLWSIEKMEDGQVRLRSVKEGTYITHPKKDKTDLELGTEEINNLWTITQDTASLFVFENGERKLSANWNEVSNIFGFYKDIHNDYNLYLYKKALTYIEIPGKVAAPTDGQSVVLGTKDVVKGKDGSMLKSEDYLLQNGMLARGTDLEIWATEVETDGTFRLKSEEGRCLDYSLTTSADAAHWQIVNGHIATTEAEPRYLVYDGTLRLYTSAQTSGKTTDASLLSVAAESTIQTDENGICTLGGGWTAIELGTIDMTNVRCVDLTAAALPVKTFRLPEATSTKNCPIFVNESESSAVSAEQTFVVLKKDGKYNLRGNVDLADGSGYYAAYDVATNGHSITYERNGLVAGAWQTLCLPFDGQMVLGTAYDLTESNDTALVFEKAEALTAGKGYLVKANEAGRIKAKSVAQTTLLCATTENAFPFKGVFMPMTVNAETNDYYFLTAAKECFKKAAAGSRLAPFRGYFTKSGTGKMNIRFR